MDFIQEDLGLRGVEPAHESGALVLMSEKEGLCGQGEDCSEGGQAAELRNMSVWSRGFARMVRNSLPYLSHME